MKIIETTSVKSLVDEIYFETETTASVVDGLGPKRLGEKKGNWPCKQTLSSLLWISGVTRWDIASAVMTVVRHARNPAARH